MADSQVDSLCGLNILRMHNSCGEQELGERAYPFEKTFLSYRNLIRVPVCFAAFFGKGVCVSSVMGFPC